MSMNHHTRSPRPGPECASFAPLLALAGQERLDSRDSSALRAHLETCSYCQHERDGYRWLDRALQRHFGPPARSPLSPGDIAQIMSDDEPPTARRSGPPGKALLRDERPRSNAPRPLSPERPTRQHRPRRLITIVSAIAAVLIIALISAALFASGGHMLMGQQKTPTSTRHIAPTATPAPYTPNPKDTFNSIAMVSPDEGWIVGSYGSRSSVGPLILHYLNGRLFQANVGAPPAGWPTSLVLQHVVMPSAIEGWAIGPVEGGLCSSSLILHYTSGQWKLESTMTGTSLFGISMLSTTDGWAVGDQQTCGQGGDYQPVLLHYNGRTWTRAQLPSDVTQLGQVVMTSATDGWAIGSNLLLHYDGQTWSKAHSASMAQFGPVNFAGIAMISASDGWLVGTLNQGPNGTASNSMLFHYDGKQWSKVNTPLDAIQQGGVNSLSLASSGDGWLVGSVLGKEPFFLQLSGGTWKQVDSPTSAFVSQVVTLSANDAWAVGPGIGQGQLFLLHYHNGTWEQLSLTSTSTPTATATSTAQPAACTSQPTPIAGAPGTVAEPGPFSDWSSYSNTTYHYTIKYPANWEVDSLNCPDAQSLTFWNYNYSGWQNPAFPSGGLRIDLNALDNAAGLSVMDYAQMDEQEQQQNSVDAAPCPAYTTRALTVNGHDAVEASCPDANLDSFYIAAGKVVLRLIEHGNPDVQTQATTILSQMVGSIQFTT